MAAVTGVMVVITLLLMIELLTRSVATSAAAPVVVSAASQARLEHRDKLTAQLESVLEREAAAPVSSSVVGARRDAVRTLEKQLRDQLARRRTERLAVAALQARRQEVREETERVSLEIAQAQARVSVALNRQRVTLLGGDASGKQTWWVRLAGDSIRVGLVEAAPGADSPGGVKGFATEEALLAWSAALDLDGSAVVILVEPSGVERFARMQSALRGRGLDVGWDIVSARDEHAEGAGGVKP